MRYARALTAIIVILLIAAIAASAMTGDGGIERLTTLSGIYAVEEPGGHKGVVCFAERSSGAMSCLKI